MSSDAHVPSPIELHRLLGETFNTEAWSRLQDAEAALVALREGKAPAEPLAIIQRFFHTLAGTAPSLGLAELGRYASLAEWLVRAGPDRFSVPQDRALSEALAACRAMLTRSASARDASDVAFVRPSSAERTLGALHPTARVVLVDDDPVAGELVRASLEGQGFEVRHCLDPLQALDFIALEAPDLILLDMLMPGIDGIAMCAELRKQPALSLVPVIFLTGRDETEQKVEALQRGGDDYVVKPFQPSELLARVRAHLDRVGALRNLALRDPLTQLYNRRYFEARLDQEIRRATRYGLPLALALSDLDGFKALNDTAGHPAGDEALKLFANLMRETLRGTDLLARLGGDEMALLFIHTGAEQAALVSDRLREKAARMPVDPRAPLTVSIGIAGWAPGITPQALMARADAALYAAKGAGKNRVHTAP